MMSAGATRISRLIAVSLAEPLHSTVMPVRWWSSQQFDAPRR